MLLPIVVLLSRAAVMQCGCGLRNLLNLFSSLGTALAESL